jgi:hypothetical protein
LFIFGHPEILDFFLKTIYERCTLHPLEHRTTWTAEEMHALIDRGDAGKIRRALTREYDDEKYWDNGRMFLALWRTYRSSGFTAAPNQIIAAVI